MFTYFSCCFCAGFTFRLSSYFSACTGSTDLNVLRFYLLYVFTLIERFSRLVWTCSHTRFYIFNTSLDKICSFLFLKYLCAFIINYTLTDVSQLRDVDCFALTVFIFLLLLKNFLFYNTWLTLDDIFAHMFFCYEAEYD